MIKILKFLIFSSLLLCVCLALSAVSLVVFVPGDSLDKRLIIGLLASLSLFTLIITALQLKAATADIRQAKLFATRDPLTNLYNQRIYWDLLGYEVERSIRQKYRFSTMLIDLDNFKTINDLYGHEVGDAYLLEFSVLFKTAIRKGDIPARYDGDNFAAILPVCDESQAYIVAKRILDGLREHRFLLPDGTSVLMTASLGMAVYPDHAKDARSLFLLADSMLHEAKVSGKDRVSIPSDEVNVDLLKSAGQKSILIMDAIRKKRFVPYFQPIISSKGMSVMAYEVLTRIVTPERIIEATDFIEAAEGMGAIGKIDLLLVEQAFDMVKRVGYEGKLFINLSPKALVFNQFMSNVRKFLVTYGLEPSQLVFEITERDTVKNLSLIERNVRDLQQEGFKFAIDDFGSGYSSFQYIKMFKVDFLKVDGEFIRNLTNDTCLEHAIVASISDLAKFLGIKTIAEFVESEAILDIVRSADIDYVQGYHVGRPNPEMLQ